mmetsp:Transcript_7525/g.11787  ORF Transcript_7525/g.11787 Transcript_7525/m.11787 type:complete len:111 (+) Transcript_7525:243-575(+)|eukprot:CAMPEP_0194227766 /NCGR_PEP_ID=MMETSP0156-20130528/43028_1 /TAXON_ID=33649 /ORGANISM="Thalassionema nitzschioides, Strain L26-B" /LENGTH=110 /DNA_ID=CAMNT_0038960259 /DNA_START=695 /DNA_END=1027 /DNA_ORIENTATION=+
MIDTDASCETVISVEEAKVFVAPTSCQEEDDDDAVCIDDLETDLRFYEIHVTATDSVGHIGKDVCTIIVLPIPEKPKKGDSGKGYDSIALKWNNDLAPSASPSISPKSWG